MKRLHDAPQRRRRCAAEIQRTVAKYRDGTHTQREIPDRHGVCVGTLRNWLNRTASGGSPGIDRGWIEVFADAPALGGSYRVELPGGRALVLGSGWRPDAVRELVSLLCQP